MLNKKNEVLSKGFEQFTDAVKQFANSENLGDNSFKDLFNSIAFKDLQDTLSNHNELQNWLQNTVDMRGDVSSGLEDIQKILEEKIHPLLSNLNSFMENFTHLNESQVFMPEVIVPFAQAVHTTANLLGCDSKYQSDEEFVRLTKELSSTTTLKNGFMKVLDAIFKKYPDVKGDMSKNNTLKKFITKVGPPRGRGRPLGSGTRKKNQAKRQKTS